MKKQFQSLTEKGRWLLATLTLIFTLGIGQMWAADPEVVTYTFTNTSCLANQTYTSYGTPGSETFGYASSIPVVDTNGKNALTLTGAIYNNNNSTGRKIKYDSSKGLSLERPGAIYFTLPKAATSITINIKSKAAGFGAAGEAYNAVTTSNLLTCSGDELGAAGSSGGTFTANNVPAGNYKIYSKQALSGSSSWGVVSIVITYPAEEDTEAPTFVSSVPANSAMGVTVSGNIVLTMSENVSVADASKFSLSPSTGVTLSTPSVSGAVITIPYSGLANNTDYTFTAAAGAIQDGASTPNTNAAFSFTFRTAAACTAPTITTDLSTTQVEYTKNATASALEIEATGDALTYQWYSNTSNTTEGGTSLGSIAQSASYAPSTEAIGTKYYYCVVSSGACTTTSAIANIKVNAVRTPGWVIFDGMTDASFTSGSIEYNAVTINYTVAGNSMLGEDDVKNRNKNNGFSEENIPNAIKLNKNDGSSTGYVSFTIPANYQLTRIILASAYAGGNRHVELATSAVTSTTSDDIITQLHTGGNSDRIYSIDYQPTTALPAGTYYMCTPDGGSWNIFHLQLVVEAVPVCTDANASIIADKAISANTNLDLEFTSYNTNTVSYDIKKGGVATTDASVTDGVFTATEAGVYVVTASQEEDATYCATSESVTITVWAPAPVGKQMIDGDDMTGYFITGRTLHDGSATIEGVSSDHYITMSSAQSSFGSEVAPAATKGIYYNPAKKTVRFHFYVNNNQASAQKIYMYKVAEGASAAVASDVSVNPGDQHVYIDADLSTHTGISFGVQNTGMKIYQIIAVESGEDLLQGGKIGYSINYNKPRISLGKGTYGAQVYDGIEYKLYADAKVLSAGNVQLQTLGTDYIKFHVDELTQVNVTADNHKYYFSTVCSTEDAAKTNERSGNGKIILNEGDWYINGANEQVKITNLAFVAPANVSYDGSGAEGSMTSTKAVVAANGFTVPDGKIFNGWEDSEHNAYAVGDIVYDNDVTLYAKWADALAVRFFPGYGTNDQIGTTQYVLSGANATPEADPTRGGYQFMGWSTDGTEANIVADVAAYSVTAATDFTAVWKEKFSVTYSAGAGTVKGGEELPTQVAVIAGTHISLASADALEKASHTFAGWLCDIDGVTYAAGADYEMTAAPTLFTAQWVNENAKVQIVETEELYETLEAALAAATTGQTVTMIKNYEFTLTSSLVISGKTVTLDLNGKTVTLHGNKASGGLIRVSTGATMNLVDNTVPDGKATIDGEHNIDYIGGKFMFDNMSNDNQLFTLEEGCVLNVNSGWYESNGRLIAIFDPNTTINVTSQKAVLIATNSNVISGNGTAAYKDYVINISNGILLSKSTGGGDGTVIYHPNEGNLNISGGTLIAENGPAVVVRGGNTNVTGGIIEANGTGTYIVGDSQVEVPADGIVWDFKAAYPGQSSIAATVSAGTISSVSAVYADAEPTATEEAAIAVSGGTFNTPVAEPLCATDYYPATKPSGKYGVTVAALSVNFAEEAAKTEGQKAWATFLADNHYDYNLGDGGEISWDKTNAYDTGLKLKKSTNNAIYFTTEPGKLIELTVGNIAGMTIQINGGDVQTITGGSNNDNLGVSYYYSDNAQSVVLKETSGNSGYNMLKSINIRDPYTVSFNANGGDAVASLKATPAITLPSATNGTQNFAGWYDALDNFIGNAGASYTPEASITLDAHWEAISTDNTLSDLKVGGETVDGFSPSVHTYYVVLPYGTKPENIPAITATANSAKAKQVAIQQAVWTGEPYNCYRAQANVQAEDNSWGYYDVRFSFAPKDMLCIIKAEHDGTATGATVTGYYGGTKDKKTYDSGKLGVKDNYMGIKLAEEAGTFKAGDVLKIYATNPSAKVRIYSDKGNTRINETDGTFDSEKLFTYTLTDDEEWIYLYRRTDGESDMNPTLGYMAVYRSVPNPLVKTITFNGAVATVDNDLKTITVEVPASTDLASMPVVATFLSNDPSLTNGAVTGGTWAEGDNEYIVTDKDYDKTTYTVTITRAIPSSDATLSALSYGGTAIALADGVYEYDVELPYGTSAVPALAATAHHAGASIKEIANADAFANRHATSTVTVKAEDNSEQVYTVNFTVSRFESKVLWDGSTMDELSDITALNIATADISVEGKSASFEEKNYTKALNFGGNTKNTRYFGIEIPAGKVAKVSVVYRSRGNSARSIIIGTAIASAIDESAIVYATKENDTELLYKLTADIFAAGTIYINTTNGFQVFEIDVQLADGYARSAMLGAGVYGTVCVPNNVAIEDIQGVTVYELMGREPQYGKLAFDEIISGELEAGVPYVFQAHGNHMALLYGTTHKDEPVYKDNGMYGTFEQIVLTELDDVYYFAQKALWSCDGAVDLTVGANRAYVKLSEIDYLTDPNPAPGRRRVTMTVNGEKVTTDIENLFNGEQPVKVMIDGQIFIIRGEKMFDATGRLVK